MIRKAGRWLSPGTLVLAALCFALPFVSVSCTTPGGYAGAAPGGTTTYRGVTLVVGGAPEVTEEHRRPVPPGEQDRLPPQPALAGALFAVLAATVLAVAIDHVRTRRAAVATVAAVGCFALVVGQAIVVGELRTRVADHLARLAPSEVTEPPGPASEYVQTGQGFVLCLVLLALVAVTNAIAWRRLRPRPALVGSGPG